MRYIYHTLSNTTRNFFAKFLGVEPIRIGTTKLISDLQKQGHTIHIYTTSFRNQIKIRLMLFYYEIKVEKKKKINQFQNQRTLKSRNINASKYPPVFGFDLHIDDLKGVKMEGERLNFKTIIIKINNENWIETVQKGITSIQ